MVSVFIFGRSNSHFWAPELGHFWPKLPKVPISRCRKMGLQVPESNKGDHFFHANIPKKNDLRKPHCSFWVMCKKWVFHFGFLGLEKRPVSGHRREKPNQWCNITEICRFTDWYIRPGYGAFFAENPFSPADKLVFTGLVVQSCHFDVTACAEACGLAQSLA